MMFLFMLLQDPGALVERLRADDIEERARAEAEIGRLGPAAEAALDGASRDADPEVASRARRLLLDVVAPHRREVAAEVRHLARHARGVGGAAASVLLDLLRWIDPSHPVLSEEDPWADVERVVGSLRAPSREAWRESRGAIGKLVTEIGRGAPCPDCARRRLSETRVHATFEHAAAEEVLGHLRDLSGLEIVLDGSAAEWVDFSRAVRLEAEGETVDETLREFLLQYGLEHGVTEEGVVLLTRPTR